MDDEIAILWSRERAKSEVIALNATSKGMSVFLRFPANCVPRQSVDIP